MLRRENHRLEGWNISTSLVRTASISLFCGVGIGTAEAMNRMSEPSAAPERPALVTDAMKNKSCVYYFGVGSNMSRTKLENRSICGTKIHVISMEPAVIPDHRLAFNMRGFPPLEPGMGSLEPIENNVGALLSYEKEECHGALICLSSEDYDRVYRSEGGGTGRMQGYEEIVVTAIPYDKSRPPVNAVAFRAREHVRLRRDPCPSTRYMTILREGANELGLKPCYQKWLADHPVQTISPLLKMIAVNNLVFTMTFAFRLKCRFISRAQSWLLFKVYVLPSEPLAKRVAGELMTGIIMFPGSIIGVILRNLMQLTGTMPPMMKKILGNHD